MNNNTYTDNNITYTWPDKMPVSSALAGLFTNALWAPIDPLDPHRQKYYNYNPVGKTPEELLKLKSISALDILWCNPKFAEESAIPRIKSTPAEINTTTDLFNWIRYYDYTFKYIKLDTHCDYRTKYLTFVVTDGGDITWSGSSSNKLSYSTDDGATWSTASDDITLSVDIGDKVLWKGTTTPIYEYGIGNFGGDNGVRYDVEGNIMSLLFGDNFEGETSLNDDYAFYQLFYENEYIVNAENLLLPATTLDDNCYGEMFYGCTNLITAPFELPATTLAGGCYCYMFENCTSLITVPSVLPATTLASGCYQGMFEGCTNLTIAPKLPATTLSDYCYNYMFFGCTSLSSITCLATNINASWCTFNWVSDIAASGTFIKDPTMENWTTGTSGIPSGWVVSNDKSKINCVKYRIFNSKFNQIGYFGNDGTDDKKLNIKSYNDLSIKSLGHINISAFNNCIKFNESELKIIGGGKYFNINMPWGSIFDSNKNGLTISNITNSGRRSITLNSGGITIKHNDDYKELFVDIEKYMESQSIEGQENPIYPRMPKAYNYTYGDHPITPIVITKDPDIGSFTQYLYFPHFYKLDSVFEPIEKLEYFVFKYEPAFESSPAGYYYIETQIDLPDWVARQITSKLSEASLTAKGLMSSTDKVKLNNAVTVESQNFNENQRKQACTNIHTVSYDAGQTLGDSQRANARAHIHAVSYDSNQSLGDNDRTNARANIHAVSYDANQNLEPADKQNARNNIGAAAASSDLIGEIKMWCSSIIPDGYLLCDGRTFDTTTYPELATLLGTNFVPDLRDRFIVGAGSSYTVGTIGGEKEHTLTINEMPSHNHQFDNIIFSENHGNIDTTKGHADGVYGYFTDGSLVKGTVGNISESSEDGLPGTNNDIDYDNDTFPYMTMHTGATGGSKPHNNIPPYYALTFIIRASGGTSIVNP